MDADRDLPPEDIEYGTLLEALVGLQTEDGFRGLIAARPEILGTPMREFLEEVSTHEGKGINLRRHLRLIVRAAEDQEAAWTEFRREVDRTEEICAELDPLLVQVDSLLTAERPAEAVALAGPAIARAREAEAGQLVSAFEALRADGLMKLPGGDRRTDVREAIAGYRRALGGTTEAEGAARILMRLAIAFAEQLEGDPADNADLAVKALRDALHYLPDGAPLSLRDDIEVNLANALMRRERGERIEDLEEGVELCRSVLAHRTPGVDGSQWSRFQLNLAALLGELESAGGGSTADADQAYEGVVRARGAVPDWHVAMAQYHLGRRLRILAVGDDMSRAQFALEEPSAEQVAEAWRTERRRLEEARGRLEKAEAFAVDDPDPTRIGRIQAELADVLDRLGKTGAALEAARRGYRLLKPERAPRECAGVARHLGHLLALRREWEESAEAFRAAVRCTEVILHSRLDAEGREREAKKAGNLSRWAAYAITAAGDPLEAALMLEDARGRELRRRLGPSSAGAALLEELPEGLRDRYLAAVGGALGSPFGPVPGPGDRELGEAVAEIRSQPGFEDFGAGSNAEDLESALEPGWPLLFVDPTPYGTVILAISTDDGGAARVDPILLEEPDSNKVFMRLLLGDGAEEPELIGSGEDGSFLLAAAGLGDDQRDIQLDVEQVLPWLGETLARPIARHLVDRRATGVTLVVCGPLAVAPLHAAPWTEDISERCLLDKFEVRYAPSAASAGASLERSRGREGTERRLLALANPDGTLAAAVPEVEAIASRFPDGHAKWTRGAAANWAFLRSHAGEATHVHLATHASAGVWSEGETAIELADGPLEAGSLTDLHPMAARVVTISACQTAVVDLGHLPEEGFSVGGAFLAAGAACAIASLWPVRDDSTALLMMRLYEEMTSEDLRPPEALRRAQLWLRDLTDHELAIFLDSHPSLKAEFRRRSPGGAHATRPTAVGDGRPYSGPDYWAPFIALGA
jgi:CHAT domain-containing protein/tetratricopeptide (TPR) repeat protein